MPEKVIVRYKLIRRCLIEVLIKTSNFLLDLTGISGVVNWESYQSLSLDFDESDSPDPDNKIELVKLCTK